MLVSELFARAGVGYQGGPDAAFERLVEDSRECRPGDLLVCLPFEATDTHQFISQARSLGAVGAIVHSGSALGSSCFLPSGDFREAVWRLAKVAFGDPSPRMRVIGITGTNGKTTTAWIMRDALEALGRNAAYIGTLGYKGSGLRRKGTNTTPFSVRLNAELKEAADSGVEDVLLEVSSHALDQRRVDGIEFDVGIFTNLTQDHLDYHETMESYADAKARFFFELPGAWQKEFRGVFNVNDPVGAEWAGRLSNSLAYSILKSGKSGSKEVPEPSPLTPLPEKGEGTLVSASPVSVDAEGIVLDLSYRGETVRVANKLVGLFNVDNTVAAFAGLIAIGFSAREGADALSGVTAAPGRFETVENDRGIQIIVDYAHTPDALGRSLETARALSTGRLIALFGCGGDRDRTKRVLMGEAVGTRADLTILTSDNPRTEDPLQIVNDARKGIPADAETLVVIDRREAVKEAIRIAEPGDVVVLAGKGHEDYQIIGRTKFPMDDKLLAQEALESLS